nr:neprilysin-1-like [Danaus plexippus plexippus]
MERLRFIFWFYLINCTLSSALPTEYCVTERCLDTASRVLAALNKSVDPCDDFYEFACGGWIEKNPVPEWATSWDQLAILREKLVTDLRELLEDKNDHGLPKSVLKAKALYRTCMDVDKLEVYGTAPITDLLLQLGLPPTPPSVSSDNFSWEQVSGRARRTLGLSVLLSVQVAEDVRNTSRNRVVLEQVSPGFSDRYLRQADKFSFELEQYRIYITSMIKAFHPDTDAERFADDIIEFSKTLAGIMTPVEVRRSGTHLFHELSVTQLLGGNGAPPEWHQVYFMVAKQDEKKARTVRCSWVVIVSLGLSLAVLAVYTTVVVVVDLKAPKPCLTEVCVNTGEEMHEIIKVYTV